MRGLDLALAALLLILPAACSKSQIPPGKDAILLSKVQSLTLRGNRMTSSRRVSPIPQLKCIGPSKKICNLYQVETMRCRNDGYDYDAEDVQWTCTATLPPEFKLGATDVICEGYRNADDKWVLKGSCGVEYRMLLTDLGERRFGKLEKDSSWFSLKNGNMNAPGRVLQKVLSVLGDLIFFGSFIAIPAIMIWPLIARCMGLQRHRRDRGRGTGWGGFWGGGGGGGGGGRDDGYYPDPPPPYSSSDCSSGNTFGIGSRQGWTPGFWTGALGGAAAGYHMGQRAGTRRGYSSPRSTPFGRGDYDAGEGSSGTQPSMRFSASSSSTGFGSTRRR